MDHALHLGGAAQSEFLTSQDHNTHFHYLPDDHTGGSEARPQEVRYTTGECVLEHHEPCCPFTRSSKNRCTRNVAKTAANIKPNTSHRLRDATTVVPYSETEVYSIAAECFTSLVNHPMDRVPGVPISVEGDLKREIDEEWTATLEILRMVTAIPGWVNKVYATWDRVESESWMTVQV